MYTYLLQIISVLIIVYSTYLISARNKNEDIDNEAIESLKQESDRLSKMIFDMNASIKIDINSVKSDIQLNNQKNTSEQYEKLQESLLNQVRVGFQDTLHQVRVGFQDTSTVFDKVRNEMSTVKERIKQYDSSISEFHGYMKTIFENKGRGTLGETQLEVIVADIIPEGYYKFQKGSKERPDCVIELNGLKLIIDAKFNRPDQDERQFKQTMMDQIKKVSSYIKAGETMEYAVMYIPSESVFTDIQRNDKLIKYAQEQNVLFASPNTIIIMMKTIQLIIHERRAYERHEDTKNAINRLLITMQCFEKNLEDMKLQNSERSSIKRIEEAYDSLRRIHRETRNICTEIKMITSGNSAVNKTNLLENSTVSSD